MTLTGLSNLPGIRLASEDPGALGRSLETPDISTVDAWVWLAYDQLNQAFLSSLDLEGRVGVVLIESTNKARRRPYHKQKLGVLLSNQRHAAIEFQEEQIPVLYVLSREPYAEVLGRLHSVLGTLHAFSHAERELRIELQPLVDGGLVCVHEHPGWMTPRSWFEESVGTQPPFRMDAFYRTVRQKTGWLMNEGKPLGGKYSFDGDNRLKWKGDPPCPPAPVFDHDAIDEEVEHLVSTLFADHPGRLDLREVPTSRDDVSHAMAFALQVLPNFGPYEDAMSEQSRGLFHSRLATLVNLHRLMPLQVVEAVLQAEAPHNSIEGFVRQMVWREYVRHIHDITDGLRTIAVDRSPAQRGARWEGFDADDGEQHPNHLAQKNPLPQAYWEANSGLRCLDASVTSVVEDGWTHHIPRLMVLSNIANLLDVHPRELTDWFHAAFIDAYDWVVEPNVLGMGTFALGTAMMTKPYVAGSSYINKMSDHCGSCQFHHKKTCPMTRLYWAYLERHSSSFVGNHRMAIAMKNVERRSDEQKTEDAAVFEHVRDALLSGREVRPTSEGDLRSWS